MSVLDRITGFSRYEQALEPQLLSLTSESQRVRVFQSHKALWLVIGSGLIYIYGLWQDVPPVNLLIWVGLIILLALCRVLVCRYVEKRLVFTSVSELYRNELLLYVSSLLSTITVGSGYWWVCLQGSDRAVFAVTLLTLIYAIGTTINSSIHYRGFPLLLLTNLGQGIVFLSVFRSPADIEISVAMLAIMILLMQFGRRNADVFAESIRIRDENREQNLKLEKDKVIIEKALNVARKANEEKNRFMAAASHDLRQPLHAMTLFLGSLRHMGGDERTRELIDKIDETSSLLHEQFNSLLDLSKFDAGVITADHTEFRLDALLKNIVDGVMPEAQAKKVELHIFVSPVTVRSDMLLLERMFRNLIINAVRYTDKGSVSVQARRQRSGLNISVIDTGIGIAADDQQRIFRDYYQVSNKARSKGKGSGLGLAIVKRIAALLEIKLTLKSEPGVGSTFSVHVPSRAVVDQADEAQMLSRAEQPEGDLAGVRALVVDDDAAILDAVTGLLRSWGCHVVSAASPEQLERLLASDNDFELVLLDDMLHDEVSGLDIARNLQQHLPRQRILLATGNVSSARLNEIREAGFVVLVKPVDYYVLRQALQDAMKTPLPSG
ncbi:ATP-binding response regulator [Pseudohongiella sp.]|uniref:histidine kinase n=1 Tax=marine sediment metagenome TaxID=412755 RepID=A0A0F9W4A1_9ZZZZ|nr:hybrid sensor histidine kinase/response regulator [Pseudohongiella sp.]HDZ07770.1 response regulator [Pseudohongiella sp.]HEA62913.1 response regulator [Pseudohongiella sp.]